MVVYLTNQNICKPELKTQPKPLTHGQEGENSVDLVELEPEGHHDAEGEAEAEDDGEDSGDGEVGPVAHPAQLADDEHGVGEHEDVADGQLVVGLPHAEGHDVAEAEISRRK